ncbi:MAG: NUDIX domain-containing protein, partial [Anaeroplasmataceae bacterium]|nr:NUDIX domain-containing protein [Anaeroplasmataceae bacterium]
MLKYTTLCYIEDEGKYLMLYRNKKKQDVNQGKWIGVGGHKEDGETIEECLLREVYEETGLKLLSYS